MAEYTWTDGKESTPLASLHAGGSACQSLLLALRVARLPSAASVPSTGGRTPRCRTHVRPAQVPSQPRGTPAGGCGSSLSKCRVPRFSPGFWLCYIWLQLLHLVTIVTSGYTLLHFVTLCYTLLHFVTLCYTLLHFVAFSQHAAPHHENDSHLHVALRYPLSLFRNSGRMRPRAVPAPRSSPDTAVRIVKYRGTAALRHGRCAPYCGRAPLGARIKLCAAP